MTQWIKNLPEMQETWVQSLGQEDPLGKGMATHSSILAWRISRTEEPGRLQSMGSQINVMNKIQDLYNKNYKTLSKMIREKI